MLARRAVCFVCVNSLSLYLFIFNDSLETSYLGIYWTNFHDLSVYQVVGT